jgi:competence protein ComGC
MIFINKLKYKKVFLNIMKGFTAIEIVFMIFILLVVAIVVIQLVVKNVGTQKLVAVVQQVEQLSKFQYMKDTCNKICENIKTASSYKEKLSLMAMWCSYKIRDGDREGIDMNDNGIYRDFYVVAGLPYCEDGTYCFHFFSCDLGNFYLDRERCAEILCEYYLQQFNGDDAEATDAVANVISPGSCKIDETMLPKNVRLLKDESSWWYDDTFGSVDCSVYVS